MSGLHARIEERRRSLFQEWIRDPAVLVTSPSAADLQARSFRLEWLDSGDEDHARLVTASPLSAPRRGVNGSVVLTLPGRNAGPSMSLWVPAKLRSYRSAFLAFMSLAYGVACTKADLQGYDVDHLLNKKRATGGDILIRVEAVPSAVNQAWGSLFEKNASNLNFWANRKRTVRSMSWMIAAKLIGKMPPRGPGDREGIRDLAQFFASFPELRMSADEVSASLSDMLLFAHRFR